MALFTLLLGSLIASFWYRLARAESVADFRRIRAIFQLLAVVALMIVSGYAALGLLETPANLDVLSLIIILLLLAAVVLPVFDYRIIALAGSCLVLFDQNNPFSIKVVMLVAFVIPVLLGAIVGFRFFRLVFEKRIGSGVIESIGHAWGRTTTRH